MFLLSAPVLGMQVRELVRHSNKLKMLLFRQKIHLKKLAKLWKKLIRVKAWLVSLLTKRKPILTLRKQFGVLKNILDVRNHLAYVLICTVRRYYEMIIIIKAISS